MLKESFIGKSSRTVMVSCVAPNMKNCDAVMQLFEYVLCIGGNVHPQIVETVSEK